MDPIFWKLSKKWIFGDTLCMEKNVYLRFFDIKCYYQCNIFLFFLWKARKMFASIENCKKTLNLWIFDCKKWCKIAFFPQIGNFGELWRPLERLCSTLILQKYFFMKPIPSPFQQTQLCKNWIFGDVLYVSVTFYSKIY